MGMIWKFKMVLLSTLAALVIIVNSAEDDYEEYHRRDLRPRILDAGTPRSYDTPWRTMDMEPITHTTPRDIWMANSSGEPPRRRRLGRKRKRRPDVSSSEESVTLERFSLSEDFVRPIHEVDSERKVADVPKRRRKKQEPRPGRWDETDENRPLRRQGQRRKRPTPENWPTFSEFNVYQPDDGGETKDKATATTVDEAYKHFDGQDTVQARVVPNSDEGFRRPLAEELGILDNQNAANLQYTNDNNQTRYQTDIRDETRPKVMEDTSFSEFSQEDTVPVLLANSKLQEEDILREKTVSKAEDYYTDLIKAQNSGPIDPKTLKEILKKSTGNSLSEILQEHNLTLADLLHGKEEVLSVLNSDSSETLRDFNEKQTSDFSTDIKESVEKSLENSETKYEIKSPIESITTTDSIQNAEVEITTKTVIEPISEKPKVEETSKQPNIRKFSTAMRRKQRIRPMLNTTYKSQLSRDMIALNARKYFNNRRRNSQEWKDLAPLMKKNISVERASKKVEVETTTIHNEETTNQDDNCTKHAEQESDQNNGNENFDDIITDRQKVAISEVKSDIEQPVEQNVTEKPAQTTTTQALNVAGLRRQAFNNRLKKKRLRQKNLTTEPPQDDIMQKLFGMPNLVSSSEFIQRTQEPKTSLDDVTILEDFLTTEMPHSQESRTKTTKYSLPRASTTPHTIFIPITTEDSAKIEIEEIFNDDQTSEKLSKVLEERNMTLRELVEHRERGSSHLHLADIFHNASKEPNPPEPFLSKSLIEPISKETYPLRALIDANNHDTTAKPQIYDSVTLQTEVNIPIVMNFGNNVNENAENMGIMSLFHNITRNNNDSKTKTALKKDSQGTLYETSITIVNATDGRNENNTIRESRVIHMTNDNQDDIVSWNEIFSLMRKNYENQTEDITKIPAIGLIPAEKIRKLTLEVDTDDDSVIVLEDLDHLKDIDSTIVSESNENLDFNTYERVERPTTKAPTILDKIPSQTKSVTVVTASIAGLAMVLFLLTYIGYRWQHQRTLTRKRSFSDERVPSPVFETRKGHKNNSSSRSISPMLTSNIYTLNTLDSRNGKESPDYMWDSLRKPFQ